MASSVFLRVPNSTVKITTEDGQMTLPWRRFFQDVVTDVNVLSPAVFGAGAPPSAGASVGQMYFDTTAVGGYQAYVWDGAWHKVL
jgi:hypothetical protein